MSNNRDQDRRRFLKTFLFAGASALVLPALQRKDMFLSALGAEKLEALSPTDPMAQALGYYEDASKVDTKKWPKKAGPDGKTQLCDNCMFYTSADKKRGKCQIFANKTVAAKGWCNSWAKKA